MLRLRVLGPVEAEVEGAPLDLGGPRQRAVLALLLVGRGEALSADRMVDQLWRGDPPPRAGTSLQAYVSNLRKVLEPDRRVRAEAKVLLSVPSGYALRLPPDAVDAWCFEAAYERARSAPPEHALSLLDEALGRWRGPAYAQFADEQWAAAEAARLDEIRVLACELHVRATLSAGRGAEAVPLAEVLTRRHPLHEEGWRLLVLALWATGRQADALGALRRGRRLLQEELGLGRVQRRADLAAPAPVLSELEEAILAQRVEVLHGVVPAPAPAPAAPPPPAAPTPPTPVEGFVGRERELGTLAEAAAAARRGGAVALVTGEAGSGKTRLLAHAGRRLAAEGWIVAAGRCPEIGGAPPAWAWVEALRSLAAHVPPERPEAFAALLDDTDRRAAAGDAATNRFLLHRAVGDWIAAAAARAPVAIVLDDLHLADAETLALLDAVAELDAVPLLLLAAYRPAEGRDGLAGTLARLARRAPRRTPLPGLSIDELAVLVAAVPGAPTDRETLAALAERTGGNPFYVTECARLLVGEGGTLAAAEVPQGVRDVLRRRFARLPDDAVTMLRLAAVVGGEAAVEVLIDAAELPEDRVLDALEAGIVAGLLTEPAPGRVRFTHALVRDTLYADLTWVRRRRVHTRVAETLLRVDPGDVAGLAHHCSQAATASLAPLAFEYASRAADLAERRYAYDAAATLLEQAIEALGRTPADQQDRDARLVDLHGRLLRAQIRSGGVAAARQTRERAIDIAERAGSDELLTAALTGWHVPTPWQTRPYGAVDDRVVRALESLLTRDGLTAEARCRLLDTLVAELSGVDAGRVALAAREELAIARRLGDPQLLAMALESSAKCRSHELHRDERERLGAELRTLALSYDLPRYLWTCEFVDSCVAGARNDPVALRRHAEAGAALAARYRLSEPEVVNLASLAMLAHIRGEFDEAEARYAEAHTRMVRHRMLHAEPFRELTLLVLGLSRGCYPALEPVARGRYERLGPPSGDLLALVLARDGRIDEAAAVRRAAEVAPDKLFTVHGTVRGELIVELGLREQAPDLIRRLLPFQDQFAGASTVAHAVQPVALTLGRLHRLLGDETAALWQFAQAEAVALRWDATHWVAAARRELGQKPVIPAPRVGEAPRASAETRSVH